VPEAWELTWRENGRRARRAFFERNISNMESFINKLGAGMGECPRNSRERQRQKERVQQSEVASFYTTK
jgi:hypothetical protein